MFSNLWETFSPTNIPLFYIPDIGLFEIIDILIIAYMVYFVLQWIRQTRAWALVKGVFFILVVAALALIFELEVVLWIFQGAFATGLIAIVILFQPELRKALEQLGRGRLFSSLRLSNVKQRISPNTVNELVKAAKEMSAVKTGALIVLEQDVALGEHEQTGIAVDALVSSQLLLNIFEKNTPLHDGAVIIRSNRVMAACCILPLTADEIGHDLGTRHRAAVGISEVSDALVIVVSEETGGISVVSGGKLTRKLNEFQLYDMLSNDVGGEEKSRFKLFKKDRA